MPTSSLVAIVGPDEIGGRDGTAHGSVGADHRGCPSPRPQRRTPLGRICSGGGTVVATPRTSSRAPAPTYVRVAGGLTALLGLAIFIWLPYMGHPWLWRTAGSVMMAGGVGLVFGQRWAWPFLLLSAIPMFYAAFVFFLPSGDTDPYELDHPFGVLFFIIGCLLVAASMTRATRGWLAGSVEEKDGP